MSRFTERSIRLASTNKNDITIYNNNILLLLLRDCKANKNVRCIFKLQENG